MTVAEEIVKTYFSDWLAEFRQNEKEAAIQRTEATLLWDILVECGQESVSLFANTKEKMIARFARGGQE